MTNKTTQIIDKLDKYMRIMRFTYTDLEKLSRLTILDDYYDSLEVQATEEKLCSIVESAEVLAKGKLILPLKVRGVFLTEGRPKLKYYTAEALQEASVNSVNAKFPLMLDHKDNEAGKIIGMVDKIEYDSTVRGLKWYGHINDETFARNVLDGAITEVSATIFSASKVTMAHGLTATDLTFKELSLVISGAEPHNYIEVDE